MSEEILKALMQLFGLITKQDGGVESSETEYVRSFLKQQLSTEVVEEYFGLFLKHSAEASKKEEGEESGKVKLTSMKDSVKILGICKRINKQLNREQKIVVLIRLYELISTDMKITDQRMAIIDTVADVFKIPKEEVEAVEVFVLKNDKEHFNTPDFMLINDEDQGKVENKYIQTSGLDGTIIILRIKSADLYFMRYTGDHEIFMNGLLISNKRVYSFPKGSFIRIPKGKPIYYTDVAGHYLSDGNLAKITYEVKDVLYRFKNGAIGIRNINLAEEQGRLIGVMGASGAGKTTLLNVLSGIEKPSEGEVLINGLNLHTQKDELEGVIGLIPQDDLLIEELTVFENLYYNA